MFKKAVFPGKYIQGVGALVRGMVAERSGDPSLEAGPLPVDPERRAQLVTAALAVRPGSCADGHNSPHAPAGAVWDCPALPS